MERAYKPASNERNGASKRGAPAAAVAAATPIDKANSDRPAKRGLDKAIMATSGCGACGECYAREALPTMGDPSPGDQ